MSSVHVEPSDFDRQSGSGVKFMGRDGAWGARHSKEGKRVGK
eukprot:COSAG06_NODE_1010_length_11086_cov_3.749613_1_plen_41_part_10